MRQRLLDDEIRLLGALSVFQEDIMEGPFVVPSSVFLEHLCQKFKITEGRLSSLLSRWGRTGLPDLPKDSVVNDKFLEGFIEAFKFVNIPHDLDEKEANHEPIVSGQEWEELDNPTGCPDSGGYQEPVQGGLDCPE